MKPIFPRAAVLPALALLATAANAQQRRVEYEVAYPNAAHHEAQVTATFRGVPQGRPLQLRMAVSSPGRYARHEFAKNVYDVRVTDASGRPLPVTRPNPQQWDVTPNGTTVRVAYTVFGDRTDGTYLGVDRTHAHMNMPATFMWARGMTDAPIRLAVRPQPGWRVATQLRPTADSTVFEAPNLQYFMDSPTEVGPVVFRSWTETIGGRPVTWRIALHHLGNDAAADTFASMVRRVVAEEVAMWGEPAGYDFGTYTFLSDYLPWASGDGMEHRNSTSLTSSRGITDPGQRLDNVATVSHEFFHSWNVERLRPRALEPFDFERENMSGELWFAEGFTSYWDALFLRRAGLYDDDQYAEDISGNVSTVLNAPGRRRFSAVEMSMQAPFVDAATSIDPVNRGNTFISYYTWGAAIGLGLDLTLRERFPGLSLEDYMRAMWRQYGRFQSPALAPERPYTLADLRRVLGEVTHDTAFANDFFRRYVEGHEAVDYTRVLGAAGFLVRKSAAGRPWLGAYPADDSASVVITQPPIEGGSLYRAGVDRGDRIFAVDGVPTPTADSLAAVMRGHAPGQTVRMDVLQRGVRHDVAVALVENPAVEVVTYEKAGMPVTDAMRTLRRQWLGSRAGAR
ncbi:M61 family metallopeptidase [Longimicrobium sp.]|uniref:M61 family metallopeptidase n=1 Tax=Longimicrobium sp. TaxID=2029185 RepID=UPI002B5A1DD4|nr:PDZ domain-containing protein [Longimicrobium sp.]HSU17243.1 PDZ domain-containing protein [Longimicrobium sp.]